MQRSSDPDILCQCGSIERTTLYLPRFNAHLIVREPMAPRLRRQLKKIALKRTVWPLAWVHHFAWERTLAARDTFGKGAGFYYRCRLGGMCPYRA